MLNSLNANLYRTRNQGISKLFASNIILYIHLMIIKLTGFYLITWKLYFLFCSRKEVCPNLTFFLCRTKYFKILSIIYHYQLLLDQQLTFVYLSHDNYVEFYEISSCISDTGIWINVVMKNQFQDPDLFQVIIILKIQIVYFQL